MSRARRDRPLYSIYSRGRRGPIPSAIGAAGALYQGARTAYSYIKPAYGAAKTAEGVSKMAKRIVRSQGQQRRLKKAVNKEVKAKRPLQRLKKEVKHLKQLTESNMGTHIHRTIGSTQLSASVGQSTFGGLTGITMGVLEQALANLKYYDPSTPGTLLTAPGATGTFAREYLFKSIISSMEIYNNYQVPVHYTLYCFSPKEDTSITPSTAYTSGLADVGGISSTSVLAYPTDSDILTDLWKIVKSSRGILQPGQCASISHSVKPFQYDPSLYDSHSLDYQKASGCHTFYVRFHGPVGHDTAAAERGFLQCALDVIFRVKYEIKYAAGADIKQYSISDTTASSFTNGGVVSERPVADNIGYSVS